MNIERCTGNGYKIHFLFSSDFEICATLKGSGREKTFICFEIQIAGFRYETFMAKETAEVFAAVFDCYSRWVLLRRGTA